MLVVFFIVVIELISCVSHGRVSRIGMIVIELCQLRASSLFLLAALGFLFGSRSSWLLLRTLPRPPEVDEEALVVQLPAAGHGARHPSRRGEAGRWGGALQRTSSYEASVAASLITSPSKKSVWSSGASSSSVASVSFIRPTTPAVTQARRDAGARRQAGGAFSCRKRCSARPPTPLGAQRDHPNPDPNPDPGPCPSPNPDPDPNPDPSPTVRWRRRGAGAAARSGVAQPAHRHACA